MSRRPVLIYALASAGMGHVTRAIPILQRLSADFEIHIFCSGQAHEWLKKQFPNVHQNHAIKGATAGGKISLPLVIARAMVEFPKSLFYIFRIALFMLIHRPLALITDFEAHSVYAALLLRKLFKVPIISCDHWTTLRMSERPFEMSAQDQKDLERWQKTIKMVTPFADQYLVHGTMKTKLNNFKAKYVPTPVRDSFLAAKNANVPEGPIVVSMGHLAPPSMTEVLEGSRHQFVIFGSKNPRKVKNIEYRAFNEEEFIKGLQASPFVIVAANSSAIDALAVGKPLLYSPTQGQFEQKYCGKMFEYLGVAKFVDELSSAQIDNFHNELGKYQKCVDKIDIFNNDALVAEIRRSLKEVKQT